MKNYDLIICGGGTAGVAAGYIAAKYGLKTLIIEKNIHLGGSITSALVIPAMKSTTNNINCEFYNDFVKFMKKYDAQITYEDGNDGWFNPEIAKIVLDEMLLSVDCDVLYDSQVVSVNSSDNHLKSIEITSKLLSIHIESKYFVDATGDANFSYLLKNEIMQNNSHRQPMTLRFQVSGVDIKKFSEWLLDFDKDRNVSTSCLVNGEIHLSTAYTWDSGKKWALEPLFKKAIEQGILKESDSAYFQLFTVPGMKGAVSLNCPRIQLGEDLDPLDTLSFSKALIVARQQIWRIYKFMTMYFPGFEESYISNIADMLGVRESRRVLGRRIYTKSDLLSGKTYDNPVLHADYPIDIHSYKKDDSTLAPATIGYELPIECLMLNSYDNVFVAGRCLSADFEAQAALRIQTSCFSMGEAIAKHIISLQM